MMDWWGGKYGSDIDIGFASINIGLSCQYHIIFTTTKVHNCTGILLTNLTPGISIIGINSDDTQYASLFTKLPSKSW